MVATTEYENMKEQLDLEQSLRQKAETYAHEVKDKHLNSPHQLGWQVNFWNTVI